MPIQIIETALDASEGGCTHHTNRQWPMFHSFPLLDLPSLIAQTCCTMVCS